MTTDQIAQKVTDRLLELIAQGVNPWRKPWDATGNTAAAATGLTHSHIVRIESGRYAVTVDSLALIAVAMHFEIKI